jgi:chromate transporter
MNVAPLASLAAYFAALSLMAIGGANAVLPDMHRHAVEVQAWMTSDEFAGLVALSQAAPGPNVLIVALIGWKAYGLPGGLTALLAMCLPSSLLTYQVAGAWQRLERTRFRALVKATLGPLTVGLILAGAYLLARGADHSPAGFIITGLTAWLVVKKNTHPLLLLAGAGALGAVGLV